MGPTPPGRRAWLRVLTGTRPGLERLLLAAFPALVAGSLGYFLVGRGVGLAAGFGVLLLVILLSRGIGD
jgi:hypothetical protein